MRSCRWGERFDPPLAVVDCDLFGLKPGFSPAAADIGTVSGIDHAWPKTAEKSSTSFKLPLHRSDRAARADQPGFSNLHGFFESSPE
jgi:hypothetical protein